MVRATGWRSVSDLPPVMGERLVGVSHTVGVFALLHSRAAVVRRVEQLARQALLHAVLAARPRRADQPANGKGLTAVRTNLDRHLVGGATDATRPDFDGRTDVGEGVVEHLERVLAGPLRDAIEGGVDDRFRDRLLALIHQAVHELGQHGIAKLGVRQNFPLNRCATTRHARFPSWLFLLGPLRAVLRTALATILDALRIEGAADDVVANAGKILHTTTADHDDRVLLKVMAFAGNVARHLEAVRQAHARDFTESRVRLLRGRRIDPGAHAALLRAGFERRDLVTGHLRRPGVPDQLVDGRHQSHPCKTKNAKRRKPTSPAWQFTVRDPQAKTPTPQGEPASANFTVPLSCV